MSDEVDSLHADKHESLLQIDTMILVGMVKHSQSSQNSKFAMSLQYLKKEVRDEVNFLHVDKHQSFLQDDFNTLVSIILQVDITIIDGHDQAFSKHSQSNNLQYFYNISKKDVRNGVLYFFSMQINIAYLPSLTHHT